MKLKRITTVALALMLCASFASTGKAACLPEIIYKWTCNLPLPEVPGKPQKPIVPETPGKPESPEKPELPETPDVPSVENNASEYELKVLELVNNERKKNGLSPLSWDNELAEVARAHSRDMAKRNFFSHNNPDGKTPFDRIRAAGINYRSAGENIAAGQKTPEEVVNAWMNSAGHRANILNGNFTKMGVGYVTASGNYKTYWTQNFIG